MQRFGKVDWDELVLDEISSDKVALNLPNESVYVEIVYTGGNPDHNVVLDLIFFEFHPPYLSDVVYGELSKEDDPFEIISTCREEASRKGQTVEVTFFRKFTPLKR